MPTDNFYSDIQDIDFALVEDTRPPMYKGLKYWGKKPHNIWSKYIETYCAPGDIILDLFAGSGVSALEALQIGRRAIAVDLNPLTNFVIKFMVCDLDLDLFTEKANTIIEKTKKYIQDLDQFFTDCSKCANNCIVINYKWENAEIYEVAYECQTCGGSFLKKPDDKDIHRGQALENIKIELWHPNKILPDVSAFSESFRKHTKNNYSNIWTRRNLAIQSFVFNEIQLSENKVFQNALLFAFISSIHLNSKMCVPRRTGANRPFSTSWGRSAFIFPNRQMEMNPLVTFQSACFGRQGVISVKKSTAKKFKKYINISDNVDDFFQDRNIDLLLLNKDATEVAAYIPKNSVDFVLTDPPYGGLIQYLALSSLWTIWLEKIDSSFSLDFDSEITINKKVDFEEYHRMLSKTLKGIRNVLKENRNLIITFHNDQINIWNSLLRAAATSGFEMEKIIYQPNRRTGESNVANPYGTSASDFYLRYKNVYSKSGEYKEDNRPYVQVVIDAAKSAITNRGEPTDYAFLLNGIYVELAKHGQFLEGTLDEIHGILQKENGRIFRVYPETDKFLGGKWWLDEKYHNFPNIPLSDRLETAVIDKLKRDISVTYDEVLASVFQAFPNGLTPAAKDVRSILNEYGYHDKKNKAWKLKPTFNIHESQHSIYIGKIAEISKQLGLKVWIGKKEQSDNYKEKKLKEFVSEISWFKGMTTLVRKRVEMIDIVLADDKNILAIIEVENSTSITSALERGSHVKDQIMRIIVIPDERLSFLERKLLEPLFADYYNKDQWITHTYNSIDKIYTKFSKDTVNTKLFLESLSANAAR